jgi:hypothetical protein
MMNPEEAEAEVDRRADLNECFTVFIQSYSLNLMLRATLRSSETGDDAKAEARHMLHASDEQVTKIKAAMEHLMGGSQAAAHTIEELIASIEVSAVVGYSCSHDPLLLSLASIRPLCFLVASVLTFCLLRSLFALFHFSSA